MDQFQNILKALIKFLPVLKNFVATFEKNISDIETKLCDLKLQKEEEDQLKSHKSKYESNLTMMRNIIYEAQRHPNSCQDNQAFINQFKVLSDALQQCFNSPSIMKSYLAYK